METIKSFLSSEKFKLKVKPEVIRIFAVIIFTIIYGIGVSWFLEGIHEFNPVTGVNESVSLYTGGIPGIAQVIRDSFLKVASIDLGQSFLGIFVIICNIPILILGWFGVSKKFTIYSLISVLLQSIIMGFIPSIDTGVSDNPLAASVLGGILVGVGVGGCLRFGTSTGGFDIISQYFALRKGKTVGSISMVLNFVIAFAGGLILGNGAVIAYTVIRIIASTLVTDKLHTAYQHIAVHIISNNPSELIDNILVKLYRGVTLIKAEGAYSKNEKTLIYVVISSYELRRLVEMVHTVDQNAFITTMPVKNVFGNFKKKTIA